MRCKRWPQAFLFLFLAAGTASAQLNKPEVLRIAPTGGPEGTAVRIEGENLEGVSAVLFANIPAVFEVNSGEEIVSLVPHRTSVSTITVITPQGRASSAFDFVTVNDPRLPDEVSYKAGYVNPVPAAPDSRSAMLWGIALADIRVPGYESATVEIASTQLSCRINGQDAVLNDDVGSVRGGLYRRTPWFGSDAHEAMPMMYDRPSHAVVLRVGQRADRIWHFWAASPRAELPAGRLDGCTVRVRAKISAGALLQIGMDYWRNATVGYGSGGNNHEAGASNWYFPSDRWQEAEFSDIGGPKF